jgi:translation elongation factor EF-1alpha
VGDIMSKQVVIYGRANSGKSTLYGYIYSVLNKLDLDRFKNHFIRSVPNYDPSKFYTWMINTDLYVQISEPEEVVTYNDLTGEAKKTIINRNINDPNVSGRTINARMRTINLSDNGEPLLVNLVDTPGHIDYSDNRDRELDVADAAVFCVSMDDIFNPKLYDEISNDYSTWDVFQPGKPIFIALTKNDLAVEGNDHFSNDSYAKALSIINDLCANSRPVPIVPVSVLVEQRKGINIFNNTNSPEMQWYDGESFIHLLKSIV